MRPKLLAPTPPEAYLTTDLNLGREGARPRSQSCRRVLVWMETKIACCRARSGRQWDDGPCLWIGCGAEREWGRWWARGFLRTCGLGVRDCPLTRVADDVLH